MQGLKTEPHYGRAIGETIFDVFEPCLLNWFRARAEREGRGYQTAMNDALKAFTREDHRPLPEVVRDVVRKELRAALKAG
jgi:hypothetical protein